MITPSEGSACAVRAGLCGAIDPQLGFVCTRGRGHPSDEHRAAAIGGKHDGEIYDTWPATPAP